MSNETPPQRPKYEVMALEAKRGYMTIIPDETKFNKEVMFALQIMRSNSDIFSKCDPDSIKNAVVNLALTGATLNPALAQAYLVPRGGKCCLDISYRGLVKIAVDSGAVIDIDATVVYEKDEFDYEMGLTPWLKHKPSMEPDPGKLMFVYAVAVFREGYRKFIVLNRKEMEQVKATSQAKSGPWQKWEPEMWRKTAVKKLYKLLPQTDRMSEAIALANELEGLTPQDRYVDTRVGKNAATVAAVNAAKEAAKNGKATPPPETPELKPCEFCGMTDGKHAEARPDFQPPESGLFAE